MMRSALAEGAHLEHGVLSVSFGAKASQFTNDRAPSAAKRSRRPQTKAAQQTANAVVEILQSLRQAAPSGRQSALRMLPADVLEHHRADLKRTGLEAAPMSEWLMRWEEVPAEQALSAEFSSIQGFNANVRTTLEVQGYLRSGASNGGGVNCAV